MPVIAHPTTPFQATLQTASFRGVPFYTRGVELRSGQRVANHIFPFRDTPYAEPLGRAQRIYQMQAFLVGDDLNAQYVTLLGVCESDGPGPLVHPSLGSISAMCVQFDGSQTSEANRELQIRLAFVEEGSIDVPTTSLDYSSALAASVTSGLIQFATDLSNTSQATTTTISAATAAPSPDAASLAADQFAENKLRGTEGIQS